MSQKTINIIIIILVAIGITIGVFALINSNKQPALPPDGSTPPAQGGLGGAFGNILNQIFKGDWLKNLFGGKSDYTKNNCDPARDGYNLNGILDPSCGGGSGSCNPFECDPLRPGYTMCGDKGFPCSE